MILIRNGTAPLIVRFPAAFSEPRKDWKRALYTYSIYAAPIYQVLVTCSHRISRHVDISALVLLVAVLFGTGRIRVVETGGGSSIDLHTRRKSVGATDTGCAGCRRVERTV